MTLVGRLLSAFSPRRPEPAPVDADDAEDARLLRLAERITPSREELREIRAKLPDDISAAAIQRGSVSAFRSVLQALLARWPELEALVQPTAQASNALSEALTPGELKILQLVAGGLSNQEIAHELVYSVGTVKWYVHQVFSKLGVSNRTQAAIRARELQLIS